MSEDLTGRRLGHYKIDGVLGRGGMSVMYRATDTRLGRKVALKVMGEHITGDAEFRERFVDEARNTSAIDHANIVPLYDFGEVDGMLYIAMRLVDGSDLAGLIADGPIAPKRALELLSQIAEALDSLHERGLVHLDLKPANVLVTSRESSAEHVYLADFGLTRRGATGHRTSSGDFLGSPTYAAPEHLRGEPVDGRTDLYALTCMLYACLTGHPPFQGEVQTVIQGHLNTEPPAVTSQVVLPTSIDEVVRRGMSKKADQRFDDCKALLAAAKQALSQLARPEVPPLRRSDGTGMSAPTRPAMPLPPQPPAGAQPPPQQAAGGNTGSQPMPGYPTTGSLPAQQPPAQQPPAPYAAPAYQQQPQAPLPPPGNDPVRLRPPMPAQSAGFATRGSGGKAGVLIVVACAVVALILIIVAVAISGGSGGSSTSTTDTELPTSVPTYDY